MHYECSVDRARPPSHTFQQTFLGVDGLPSEFDQCESSCGKRLADGAESSDDRVLQIVKIKGNILQLRVEIGNVARVPRANPDIVWRAYRRVRLGQRAYCVHAAIGRRMRGVFRHNGRDALQDAGAGGVYRLMCASTHHMKLAVGFLTEGTRERVGKGDR